jgi:hypothetical protein
MKHVRQPQGSSLCGQACIAMLLRCSLIEACSIVRRSGGTKTEDLARALRKRGFPVNDRLSPWRGALPERAVLKVRFQGRARFHWVLAHKGLVFDPMKYRPHPFSPSLWRRRSGRVTAYLAVPQRRSKRN